MTPSLPTAGLPDAWMIYFNQLHSAIFGQIQIYSDGRTGQLLTGVTGAATSTVIPLGSSYMVSVTIAAGTSTAGEYTLPGKAVQDTVFSVDVNGLNMPANVAAGSDVLSLPNWTTVGTVHIFGIVGI